MHDQDSPKVEVEEEEQKEEEEEQEEEEGDQEGGDDQLHWSYGNLLLIDESGRLLCLVALHQLHQLSQPSS